MTSPIWMAAPPEVHSALLSSGPGLGPLQAAAAAWAGLGEKFALAAVDISFVLGEVSWQWEGTGAESYVAENIRYKAWLAEAALVCAEAAAALEAAAAAYSGALAEMPTLTELTENHTVHEVLVAMNFFGVNVAPIALNEADYVRMWIQAAGVMGVYQACSTAALAAVPPAAPAPVLVNPGIDAPAVAVSHLDMLADNDDSGHAGFGSFIDTASVLSDASYSTAFGSMFDQSSIGVDCVTVDAHHIGAAYYVHYWQYQFLPQFGALLNENPSLAVGLLSMVQAAAAGAVAPATISPAAAAGVSLSASLPLGVTQHLGDVPISVGDQGSYRDVLRGPDEASGVGQAARPSSVHDTSGVEPMPLEAGSQHAGTSGFAGTTASKAVVQPAGLVLFGGDEYGRGAASPLLPSLWQANCFAPVGEDRMVELALS